MVSGLSALIHQVRSIAVGSPHSSSPTNMFYVSKSIYKSINLFQSRLPS